MPHGRPINKNRQQLRAALLSLIAITTVAALTLHRYFNHRNPPQPSEETENRIPKLKKLVADLEDEAAHAVANYQPKTNSPIDDLSTPAADLLRQLLGVVQVEVAVRAEQPTHRIVHLRDYHFVPRELYAMDVKGANIDQLYREFLLEVEAVQLEQMALLRCLIKHHGLRRIYAEGLTAKDLPNYKQKAAVLRDMEKNQIAELRKQLTDVRELLNGMEQAGRTKTDRYERAKKIGAEITEMIEQHRVRLLEFGAAGRLHIAGEIDDVLPLDDADLLEKAKPITPEGRIEVNLAKLTARQDAQVRSVLDHGVFGLIVLGGAHDLSASVRRLGRNHCEYIRVTTSRVRDFSD